VLSPLKKGKARDLSHREYFINIFIKVFKLCIIICPKFPGMGMIHQVDKSSSKGDKYLV
jgi:hypothetical protein